MKVVNKNDLTTTVEFKNVELELLKEFFEEICGSENSECVKKEKVEKVSNPFKGFHTTTLHFIQALLDRFGNNIVYTRDPFFQDLRRTMYQPNFSVTLSKLEEKGLCQVVYNDAHNRVTNFKFNFNKL